MSTQTRTTGSGGRNTQKKPNSTGGGDSVSVNKKSETKPEKEKPHQKPTAEQMRIAQITDINSADPKMGEKVATLIEMTQRSEEEVCCALYECDNNLEKAVVFLLETLPVGAFETSSKKKRNKVANASTENTGDGEWVDSNTNNTDKREKSRNRSSTRGGRGGSDSRGYRGRESREHDRNISSSEFKNDGGGRDNIGNNRDGGWRGRGRGSSRGGFGGRGGRGGRMGPRGMGSRDERGGGRSYSRPNQEIPQEVDTWDNTIAQNAEKQHQQQQAQDDAWGDWDNEEYVGSLKDSKVFTPSNLQNSTTLQGNNGVGGGTNVVNELSAPPGLEQHIVNPASHLTADDLVQQYSTTVVSSTSTAASAGVVNSVQYPDIHTANPSSGQHLRMSSFDAAAAAAAQQLKSATLSAEQSQYFNSLPSQNVSQQANSYQNTSVQYPASYGTVFGDQSVAGQTSSVRRARAKVPPPSKIPASAVEMPGDTLNNIGYLDVQFGGLDFGTEESFDTLTEKFNPTTIDSQQNIVQSQEVSNDYQTKANVQQSTLTAGLQSAQIADSLTSGYSQRTSGNVQTQNTGVGSSLNSSGNNALDQLSKNDPYNQSSTNSTGVYQNAYNTNSGNKATSGYQSAGTGQVYNSANYSNTQVSSGNTYQPSANNYNSYNQNSVNSYQQQSSVSGNSSSNSVVSGGAVNNSSSSQNIPVGNSAVNNSSSNSNPGYLPSQYQSNQTTSAFPSQQNAYQNNQSVYGGTGLSNNSGFTGSTNASSSQYSNFNSSKLKETSTTSSSHFESVASVTSSSAVSSTPSSVSSSSVVAAATNNSNNNNSNSMSSPSLGLTNSNNSKVTANSSSTSSAKSSNASGMVPNIQMVSQYIQTGMPYYQQPAVYSYEEVQMMQQRMPHVAQYYDINYPPTSLGAAGVRDASLGSVAYSTMTDGRFARTDNNSSPVSNVSSTMSQQAGSGGPMLNVPYAYFYGANMMPGGFQYGTPAIYPPQMQTANASSGGQFPKPSYNSGYGSGNYDALSQATQDYNKGSYPGSSVSQQTKTQSVTNAPQAGSGSDIASSMYAKSHVALNKVNSYEKQSFHSGTPPPFNLTGTQTAGATSAQTYGMYIPAMPATHHNMNMHQPIHQDSNSTGQRQQSTSQSKSANKQGYSPSYWTAQN